MKLTKETLKQIIKEELEAVMDEGFMDMFRKKKAMPAEQPVEEPEEESDGGKMERILLDYIEDNYDRREYDQAKDIFDRLGEMSPSKATDLMNKIKANKDYLGGWLARAEDMLTRG